MRITNRKTIVSMLRFSYEGSDEYKYQVKGDESTTLAEYMHLMGQVGLELKTWMKEQNPELTNDEATSALMEMFEHTMTEVDEYKLES